MKIHMKNKNTNYYSEEFLCLIWKIKKIQDKEEGYHKLKKLVPKTSKLKETLEDISALCRDGVNFSFDYSDNFTDLSVLADVIKNPEEKPVEFIEKLQFNLKDFSKEEENELLDYLKIKPVDKKNTCKEKLNKYLSKFRNDELISFQNNYLGYKKQKKVAYDFISNELEKFGNTNLNLKLLPTKQIFKEGFLPVHTFLSLSNELDILDISTTKEPIPPFPREVYNISIKIEDKDELNMKMGEVNSKKIYEIKYDSIGGEIFLKDYEKDKEVKMSKTNYESTNEVTFSCIFANPGQDISREDIKKSTDNLGELNKKLTNVISDLNFKGKVRDIFFPRTSKDKVKFINPITVKYLEKRYGKDKKDEYINLDIEEEIR